MNSEKIAPLILLGAEDKLWLPWIQYDFHIELYQKSQLKAIYGIGLLRFLS